MTTTYKTSQGDTWDLISWKSYGSEYYIDVLMQANSSLMDYVIFPSGIAVTVPDVETRTSTSDLPPWKR